MLEFYDRNSQIGFVTCIVHVTLIFVVAIVLINLLTAILSSPYDHMMRCREVVFQMQSLSVSVLVDQMFVRLLVPLPNFLRWRRLVHENGRYYVMRVIAVNTNQTQCICYRKIFEWISAHCCHFCSKINIWNVNCARATAFIFDSLLWKCRSFGDGKCVELRGTRTPNLRIHSECSNHLN